jgi:hypothetical protein
MGKQKREGWTKMSEGYLPWFAGNKYSFEIGKKDNNDNNETPP